MDLGSNAGHSICGPGQLLYHREPWIPCLENGAHNTLSRVIVEDRRDSLSVQLFTSTFLPLYNCQKLALNDCEAMGNVWRMITCLWKCTWVIPLTSQNWAPICFAAHSPVFRGSLLTLSIPQ